MSSPSDDVVLGDDVDSFLKEQGFWEEGMSAQHKIDLFKIVQISKQTALEENQRRSNGTLFKSPREDREILGDEFRTSSGARAHHSVGSLPRHQQQQSQQQQQQSHHHNHHQQTHSQQQHHHPQRHHQDSSTSDPQEPPVRTRRKKNINSHMKQDSLPTPVADLRLDPTEQITPPEVVDPRLQRELHREQNEVGSIGVNKMALHLALGEDQNRGLARIDNVLQTCHALITNQHSV